MNLLKQILSGIGLWSRTVAPRQFPTTGFSTLPALKKAEEENWAWYTPQSFYPVNIGNVLHSRYQVLYKLGYGTTSTVWMCRDLHRDAYVCMKSLVCDYSSVQRETEAYTVLSKQAGTSTSFGKKYVRHALDQFEIVRDDRHYHFLIHEPLGASVQFFLNISGGRLPSDYVRELAWQMLSALEYLHSAGIIHADLQAKNILLRINDESVLKDGEDAEVVHPSSRKITKETTIVETRDLPGPLSRWIGDRSIPVLCDFGEARTGKDSYEEHIQPATYRAPEVFLYIPWGPPVDIWNFGCMVWTFIFGCHLFPVQGGLDDATAERNQLARMVALLGPPPKELLTDSGPRALEFFNEDGSAKMEVPSDTLESVLESSLPNAGQNMTDAECKAFLAFMRRILTWTAEKRPSASELLTDPWFTDFE